MKKATPMPDDESLGKWDVYVAEGKTKEDRNARLLQAPEKLRPDIIAHVTLVFKLKGLKK